MPNRLNSSGFGFQLIDNKRVFMLDNGLRFGELVFSEFADRFNAVEDVQENSELRKEITDEIAMLISKALEFWPNRK